MHPEAHNNLGNALYALGKLDDAMAHYERALTLKPDCAEAHNNLGNALCALGKFDDAVAHYERALALKPDYPEAHNNLGNALCALGKFDDAMAHYERALALKPDYPEAHNNLGNALYALGKPDDAMAHYERALTLKPDYAEAHNNLGNVLYTLGKFDDAMAHYERALALKPDYPEAHNNLGNALYALGKFDDAMAHYERALALKPDYAEAHHNRANAKKFHASDTEIDMLEKLATTPAGIPTNKLSFINFALGKALEDVGDYARAFQHFLKGNALKRQQIYLSEKDILTYFKWIEQLFDAHLFERLQGKGDPSRCPIFIVGMPRSGSTLVEQILASHPQVHGGGELTDLTRVANTVSGPGRQPLPYPKYIPRLDPTSVGRLGQAYLACLPNPPNGKSRVTDKQLGNFAYVGLIRLILPNAKIIHVVRNPADTCVSCFATLFSVGQEFSYDLAELGRYYRYYSTLMTHWHSVLPPEAMLDVCYEDLVRDFEQQARRLIAYCDLPWADSCLRFHKTVRPIATASAVQVRQPLFRSSLKRWLRFENFLEPLLTELGDLHRP
jgi:tetratricopeptide (TPR) repeat protein